MLSRACGGVVTPWPKCSHKPMLPPAARAQAHRSIRVWDKSRAALAAEVRAAPRAVHGQRVTFAWRSRSRKTAVRSAY
jgi:hypothetical protein